MRRRRKVLWYLARSRRKFLTCLSVGLLVSFRDSRWLCRLLSESLSVNETLVPWLLLLHLFQIVYDRFSHLSIGFIFNLVCKFLLIKKWKNQYTFSRKDMRFTFIFIRTSWISFGFFCHFMNPPHYLTVFLPNCFFSSWFLTSSFPACFFPHHALFY